MNRTLKLLMFSDIFVLTGFGLIGPIFAIFIKENLVGGSVFAAGFATTLFIITKSCVQLSFSRYVDRHDDSYRVAGLILGTLMIVTTPFIYFFAENINLIYLAQIMHGIGSGLAYPTWLVLWTTHLDKHKESFEWSVYSTVVGLGTAVSAAVGATIAEFLGFRYTFLIVGMISLIGCFTLFGLSREFDEEFKSVRKKIPKSKRKR